MNLIKYEELCISEAILSSVLFLWDKWMGQTSDSSFSERVGVICYTYC